jgi:hypothetical protein
MIVINRQGYDSIGSVHGEFITYAILLRFYYIYSDFTNKDKLIIEVKVDNRYRRIMFYVSIVLITMSGLVILCVIAMLIRCCIQRRQARIADPFQSNTWRAQADQRFNRIMNECPIGAYNQKTTQFGEVSCAICLVLFQDGNTIRTLSCQHVFHQSCIEEWIKTKIGVLPRCPSCNIPVTNERPPGYVEMQPIPPQ